MWPLVIFLLAPGVQSPAARTQLPTEHQVLEAEHARAPDPAVLVAGTRVANTRIQRLSVRAIGRLERPSLLGAVEPLLHAPDASVRREAVNALGQMNVRYPFASLLHMERDPTVRAVIYETIGRVRTTPDSAEMLLARGLGESSVTARAGAARGLESLVRRATSTTSTTKLSASTIEALRQAVRDPSRGAVASESRENALLALSSAGDRDSLTLDVALHDHSEQVRRVAVATSRRWVDDPSYIVRWQALRSAGNCERFIAAISDVNEHVALLAVDSLGGRPCGIVPLAGQVDRGRSWRMQAHALVSLAKVAPDSARTRVPRFVTSPIWQARTYAATAARLLSDTASLAVLARDAAPNVAIAAMRTSDDAIRGLASDHAALVMASVDFLTAASAIDRALGPMLAALDRFTKSGRATVREPRVKLLEALQKHRDTVRVVPHVRALLADGDPAVATAAANVVSALTGTSVHAVTTRYEPAPLPADACLRALRGATALVRLRDIGTITIALLSDEAPVAVATFVDFAEAGKFNGLTFHRIVPNFVVQGGSPGANEYVSLTPTFMRDELGLTRNARGTFGVSTRGRDTGDGQIYVNLIDNFRLDHDYTVFARTLDGLDVIDRIQEGDVIESIRVVRRPRSR